MPVNVGYLLSNPLKKKKNDFCILWQRTNPPKSKKLSVASMEQIFKILHQIVAINLAVGLVTFPRSMSSSLKPRTGGNSFLLIFPVVSRMGIL